MSDYFKILLCDYVNDWHNHVLKEKNVYCTVNKYEKACIIVSLDKFRMSRADSVVVFGVTYPL